ncbi:MAG: sodium/solute symporter [Candidatus Latescibacterota bacterium]
MFRLNSFDILIFAVYMVSVLLIGFIAGRKKQTRADGFFLARRTLPWYAVGFSMTAACISTEQFIGASAKAHDVGMAVLNWEWGIAPSFALLILVFMPLYFRREIFTIPEYLERRFGKTARTIFSLLTMVSYFAINLAGILYSGAYVMHSLFGFNLILSIWVMTILTGAYTVYGGLVSVVWTETLQSVLLLAGGALITVLGLLHIPGGLMTAIGTGDRAHLFLPLDHPELPWTAILVLIFSTNVWYACTNQFYIQMCLGAKNEWHARMGVVFATFLGILLGFAVEFTGIVGYRLVELGVMPAPPESNAIYPYLIQYIVPAGIRGIVFAGIIAAIMSTVSALVHSIATLFSMDFYRAFIRPKASETHLIKVGQIAGATLLAAGALCAPIVGTFPTIFDYFQQSWAVMAAPIAIVFTLGALWKRATNKAAVSTLILGILTIPVAFWLQRVVLPKGFNFYNLVGIIFFVQLAWMIVVSLLTRPFHTDPKVQTVWTSDLAFLPPKERPSPYRWYLRVVLWWAISVAVVGALYIKFW